MKIVLRYSFWSVLFICAIGLHAGCRKDAAEDTAKSLDLAIRPENSMPNTQDGITPVPKNVATQDTQSATAGSAEAKDTAVRASVTDQASGLEKDETSSIAPESNETVSKPVASPSSGAARASLSDGSSASENATQGTVEVATAGSQDSIVANTRVEYRELQNPSDKEAEAFSSKQWLQQLALIDRALQSLLLDQQANAIAPADFAQEARRLSELKLQGSEALIAKSTGDFERDLGILGKLEALSQLAGLGDRIRATELLAFATENSTIQSKEVARQAALVLLGFSLNSLNNDAADPQLLLQQVDTVLSDRDRLRLPEFSMMDKVVTVLQRKGFSDVAKQVTAKTIEAFRSNADANIAYKVWQLEMAENADFQSMLALLKSTSPEPALVRQSIQTFFEKYPSDWAMVWLAGEIKNLEFTGSMLSAGVIAEFLNEKLNSFKSETLKSFAATEIDAYKLHAALMNQPLVLSELVDGRGSPFTVDQLKGKVVFVTFWASWCPTCRSEFPDLIRLHETYSNRGFEILGVNLDESASAMNGVLQATNLPGIHVRSSNPARQGVNSLAAEQVGLRATPFSLLLDREGKVIKLQVHGQELEKQIDQLLTQQ